MKKSLIAVFIGALFLTACNNNANDSKDIVDGEFQNDQAKHSYALGMDIGDSVKELPVEVSKSAFIQGIKDTLNDDDKALLDDDEKDVVLNEFLQNIRDVQTQKIKDEAKANAKQSKAFLKENAEKEGVHVTDSGLQYKVLKEGDGKTPGANDTVTVNYEGKLIDGTVFDSTYERDEPVTFAVSSVIEGWTEALQLMHKGAKYRLFIPADLAYGSQGAGAKIGPNQALIFDVELVDITPAN